MATGFWHLAAGCWPKTGFQVSVVGFKGSMVRHRASGKDKLDVWSYLTPDA
jgi:hypothetical protein